MPRRGYSRMNPLPSLPFKHFVHLSTQPISGFPLPKEDRRIESADTVTLICKRYLYRELSRNKTMFKAAVSPSIDDITVYGVIDVESVTYQNISVFYTGAPVEVPLLQPHELPYATVVTLVVTFIKPSRYHTKASDFINLDVRPEPLELRGTTTFEPEVEAILVDNTQNVSVTAAPSPTAISRPKHSEYQWGFAAFLFNLPYLLSTPVE